jgi:hypothetical protein
MGRRRRVAASLLMLKGFSRRLENERKMARRLQPTFADLLSRARLFAGIAPDRETFTKAIRGVLSIYRPTIRDTVLNLARREALKGYRQSIAEMRKLGFVGISSPIDFTELDKDLTRLVDDQLKKYPDFLWHRRDSLPPNLERGLARPIARAVAPYALTYGAREALHHNNIRYVEWVSVGDERVRLTHSHAGVHGQVRELGKEFSNGCRWPKDPSAPLKETVNCRCRLRPALSPVL